MRNDQEPNTKSRGIPKDARKSPQEASDVKAKDLEKLSAEEQLAAYEESLKEDDWGHQPC